MKIGFAPLLPGFRHLPFNDLKAVEEAISDETVAILVEAVQGEGGRLSLIRVSKGAPPEFPEYDF